MPRLRRTGIVAAGGLLLVVMASCTATGRSTARGGTTSSTRPPSSPPGASSTSSALAPGSSIASTPSAGATAATALSGLASATMRDLSWVSSDDGWVLADRPCDSGRCAVIARTFDGGAHWQELADPQAVVPNAASTCQATACVSELRFASRTIGYLFGPALLVTTDGGRTWRRESHPQVETLTVVGGTVYRLAYTRTGCPGPCSPSLQAATPGASSWRTLIGSVAVPARSDSADLVGSGSTLLLATYGSLAGPVSAHAVVYRSTDAGRTWTQTGDPCSGRRSGEQDLIALAVAPGGFAAGICSPHGQRGQFVITSYDMGATWHTRGMLPDPETFSLLAAASSTRLVAATGSTSGNGPFVARLSASSDGGMNWTTFATDRQQITGLVPAWLGFETTQLGRWISGAHHIWTTRDGGRTWTESTFR